MSKLHSLLYGQTTPYDCAIRYYAIVQQGLLLLYEPASPYNCVIHYYTVV